MATLYTLMSDLTIELVDIDSILQDPANARLHSEEQLKYIAKSLERFGQQKPLVVDRDNIIVAGNGTHAAAKEILGWTQVAVIYTDLSAEEARAYGIADNQIATQSEWDLSTLSKHIKDMAEWNPMQDWNSIGFEAEMINPIVEEGSDVSALHDFLNADPDEEQDGKPVMAKPIRVTEEMRETINRAINTIRINEQDFTITEGRALELITADWLAGVEPVEADD